MLLAALIVFFTGFLDDIIDLAPPGKVTGVVMAGIVLSYFGATMFYFRVPFFDVVILSSDWTPLVTVLWLLGMTQAINLIDGLDGLAGRHRRHRRHLVLPLRQQAQRSRVCCLTATSDR